MVGVCPDQAGSIIDRHCYRINLAGIIQALRLVYGALWLIARILLPALLDEKVNGGIGFPNHFTHPNFPADTQTQGDFTEPSRTAKAVNVKNVQIRVGK